MSTPPNREDDSAERFDARNWAGRATACVIWGAPAILMVVTDRMGGLVQLIAWPALLVCMGAACLLNARRCHRRHCYFTGPYFLFLAAISLLYGLGILPLGERGWSTLSLALIVGGAFLFYVPERLFGRYVERDEQ